MQYCHTKDLPDDLTRLCTRQSDHMISRGCENGLYIERIAFRSTHESGSTDQPLGLLELDMARSREVEDSVTMHVDDSSCAVDEAGKKVRFHSRCTVNVIIST